eukprot:scaffold565469_cov45-Prasinocladus_malaysianus.AAC.1
MMCMDGMSDLKEAGVPEPLGDGVVKFGAEVEEVAAREVAGVDVVQKPRLVAEGGAALLVHHVQHAVKLERVNAPRQQQHGRQVALGAPCVKKTMYEL